MEGFLTDFGDASYLEKGFSYIKAVKPGKRILILTKVGSEIRRQEIDTEKTSCEPKSRYEIVYGDRSGRLDNRRDIDFNRSVVRDRTTGEVPGDAVSYHAYAGWVDRMTIAQFGRLHWMCPGKPDQTLEMLKQVILPMR